MKRKKKGSAMVEFVIVIPVTLMMLFATWQLFNLSSTRIQLIKAGRTAAWEKLDTTGGVGGSDPRPNADIIADVEDFYDLSAGALTLEEHSSITAVSLNPFLIPSFNQLGLNSGGLWEVTATETVSFPVISALNRFIPGDPLPLSQDVSEKNLLLTDSWDSTSPGESVTSGQVRDRVSGYWLLGPGSPLGGGFSSAVNKILNFEINLSFFGTYSLSPEKPPRVNLSSVPDRT